MSSNAHFVIATENRDWGYRCIYRELSTLAPEPARGRIFHILKSNAVESSPERVRKTT